MIFFWGQKNKVLKTYSDRDFVCESCNSPKLNYVVRQQYFHLFWIPVVPIDKFVGTYCNNCRISRKEIYSQNGAHFNKVTKTPIFMYSWLIIIGLLILYTTVNSISVKNKEKEYIKNPIKGDVYSVKFKDDKNQDAYSLIKVVDIANDSIYFFQCNVYYNQSINTLNSDEYFIIDTFANSATEIANMYDEGIITRIERNYETNTGFSVNKEKVFEN
jgi:hypothetical protein